MIALRYIRPPYPVVGSKWQWISVFEDFRDEFESYDTIIDLYGGACWVSYWLQERTRHPRLFCNDYDSYIPAITEDANIAELNRVFSECLDIYESCPFTDEELQTIDKYRFLPSIGRNRQGIYRHESQFRAIKELIASLPTRAMKTLVFRRFWCAGAPAPNSLNYPSITKRFKRISGYIDPARVTLFSEDALGDVEGLLARYAEGKTLVIADPPFSVVQKASQYYDGDMNGDCTRGSPCQTIYDRYFPSTDLIVFSDTEQLADMPEPSEMWIRETNNKPFGSAKYHHPVAQRIQGAYIYRHKED